MDEILRFYLNLNYAKRVEEEIVRGLRVLNAPWIIKEQNEAQQNDQKQQTNNEDIQKEIDENIDQLKQIEELLNKAQKVYTKANQIQETASNEEYIKPATVKPQISAQTQIKPKQKDENEPKIKSDEKPPTASSSSSSTTTATTKSRLPLSMNTKTTNVKKPAVKPVYMNAPFKTEPINTFKSIKPRNTTTSTIKTLSNSATNLTTSSKEKPISTESTAKKLTTTKDLDENNQELKTKYSSQTDLNDNNNSCKKLIEALKNEANTIRTVNEPNNTNNEKEFTFNLKANGKELRLPPNLEDLVVKNYRLKQNLYKIYRNQNKSNQSSEKFREKLEKSCLKQSSPAFLHHLIYKMTIIYNKLANLIKKIISDFEPLINNTVVEEQEETFNNEINKLKLIKLHKFYDKCVLFEEKLNQQLDEIYLQIKTYYKIDNDKNKKLIENKIYLKNDELNNFDFENEFDDDCFKNFMPMTYKNENELKKYFSLKLNLIELEFKNLYFKYLNDFYLNLNYFKNNFSEDVCLVDQFNLLFNLVTDKRTIIVKQ